MPRRPRLLVLLAALRRSPGAPGHPRRGIACTIALGDAVQKVTAVVRDLKGTVVVRG